MNTEGTKDFSATFSPWFGKPVVLLVAVRQCTVPMPCSIVAESIGHVRIRVEPGWEVNVRKELTLAIEEDATIRATRVN